MPRDAATWTLMGMLAASLIAAAAVAGGPYDSSIEAWREGRVASLKADDGWLTVCGLAWLRPGTTLLGSNPGNDVVLPAHAPGFVGEVTLEAGKVSFRAAPGARVTRDGKPFESGTIRPDADEHPDVLAVGDVKVLLLRRGERLALRIKDNRSPIRARFAGLRWYRTNPAWRISAKFVAYPEPIKMAFDTIVGEQDVVESPGYVTFDLDRKTYRLQAARLKDGSLWFVFRDGTSGRTTAGGARQLTTDPPQNGEVILDFNKAVNLPCAYIPYATCPLAPPQNRLALAIEAGEQVYEPGKPADGPGR